MVKSFSAISCLALAVLAQANYMPPQQPEYTPVYEATTTSCTESSQYAAPTGYGYTSSSAPGYYSSSSTVEYGYPVSSSSVEYGYPVSSSSVEYGYPVSSTTPCETAEPTPYTYTSVYTSCEVYPTVYTSEGTVCTTDYSTTHYMTTTVCDTTPVETPCPTTITKSYETTYSSCVTYPTTCTSEGTEYTTQTSSTSYSTSTVCTTEVYTPVPTHGYTHSVYTDTYKPPTGTGYPVPSHSANSTTYGAPTYPVSTGGAASLAPKFVAIAAVFGGIVAALF
jgi:hypothetical protein